MNTNCDSVDRNPHSVDNETGSIRIKICMLCVYIESMYSRLYAVVYGFVQRSPGRFVSEAPLTLERPSFATIRRDSFLST